ncbi:hypothetical protein IAD21_01455 [Abditibacteriota bacterium]|nr:hypothetical protein IAD21_01455 [Abditibacteriota bacterium]
MSTASRFLQKVVAQPDLGMLVFDVAVLGPYIERGEVKRTNTVGRVKTANWSLDFGIAPDEKTIHVPVGTFALKVPEKERTPWLEAADDSRFSENFLKMLSSHACIDDGNLRAWGEEPADSFF